MGSRSPVEVTRKHVKNLNLRVRGDGSVALSIPQRLSFTRAQAFLDCKASWIIERVRRAQMRNTRISPTEGESDGDGRTSYPLWGDLTPLGPTTAAKTPSTTSTAKNWGASFPASLLDWSGDGRPRLAVEHPHDEDALGFVHPVHRRHSH
mgnify:CR=1 FL=1